MFQVLVIDDDPGTLDGFERVLHVAGFGVTTASTGRYGLGLARRARFDVILADERLPDFSGLDILAQLRGNPERAGFILMTGCGSDEIAGKARELGATGYAEKPLFAEDLVRVVSVAADRAPRRRRAGDYRVNAALDLLAARLHDRTLTVRVVARELHVTTEHLCRLIKHHTGLPFGMHIDRARVAWARRLLQATMLSVKEIADHVGYGATARLDHHFVKMTAMTPSEYRRTLGRYASVPSAAAAGQ